LVVLRYGLAMTQAAHIQPPEPYLDSYHDMTVGQILKRTREYYGQTIPQVEINLRIRSSQLMAIEEGNVAHLPGRVYAIGFVRAYAEYLGLDGDKMVHLFKAQTVGKENKVDLQFPVTYADTKTPNAYIIMGCLVGIILLIAYWSMTYKPANYIEVVPPVPEELKQGSVPLLKPDDVAKAEEPVTSVLTRKAEAATTDSSDQIATASKNKMELVVTEDSWVEIKDASGKAVLSQVLKPGDKYIVPEEEGYVLSTGNAGGITVFVDGKKQGKLGKSTEVKRGIALNPEDFKNG